MNLIKWKYKLKYKQSLLKVIYMVIILITAYYSIITMFNLLFLIPLIIFWAIGVEDIEFFNTLQSDFIRRTDISYFTTRDIMDSIEMLLLITALISIIKILGKRIK